MKLKCKKCGKEFSFLNSDAIDKVSFCSRVCELAHNLLKKN